MLPQIAPVIGGFATEGAFVASWASLRRLHNVLVKLLVAPCKEQA